MEKRRRTDLLSQRQEFTLGIGENHGDTTNIIARHDVVNICDSRGGDVGDTADLGHNGKCGGDSTEEEGGGKGEGKRMHF